MNISLVGLTLHVADVERSLNFYKRLPDSSILFHMPDAWGCSRIRSGPFTSRLIVRTWMQRAFYSKRQGFSRRVRQREHGEKEMHLWLTLMATLLSSARHMDRRCEIGDT